MPRNTAELATSRAAPELAESARTTLRGDRRFRPDIQGLRAVAVTLVVLYHCGVPGFAGGYVGVDVFFVISGFLITRQLIAEHSGTGRISLAGFYARRIKRLLPSALTVILVTELLARFWGPPLQASGVAKDGIFSTFYLMNYRLAALGIDYQNAGGPVSPLQHFWSLAVEEQFYIVWPIAIIGVGILARRTFLPALTLVALSAVAASLAVSVIVTGHNAQLAYFAIQTRAWELGIGALIALTTPLLLRLPGAVAAVGGWCGLALIVAGALLFTDATPFPGIAAALPVAGAALVVLTGLQRRSRGAELVLQARPMQFVGRISYGWYLWHWPLIVLAPAVLGVPLGWPGKIGAALFAFALAVIGNLLIEQKIARRPSGRRVWFATGAAMSAIVTGAAVLILVLPQAELHNSGPAAQLDLVRLDAAGLTRLLDDAYASSTVPSNLSPGLAAAVQDLPPTSSDGCHADFLVTTEPPCVFGDTDGTRTIVLYGDSHAEQWFGALDAMASSSGWKLISWTKAACPLADVLFMNSQLNRPYTECPAWRADTQSRIAALHPDLVVASGADPLPGPDYPNTTWSAETTTTLSTLKKAARQVVYLADTPLPSTNVPVCLAAELRTPQVCSFTRASLTDGLTQSNQQPGRRASVIAAAEQDGIQVVDPTDWFCGTVGCPAIVDDTLVYRDATHMTQAYSKALAPTIGNALARVVPWMSR